MKSFISHNYVHSNSFIPENIDKDDINKVKSLESFLKIGDDLFNYSKKN